MQSCYTMLIYAPQGAVNEFSFLAKPHQPNKHDDLMALVDPLQGYESDTFTPLGNPWYGPHQGPAHDHNHNQDYGLDIHSLTNHEPILRPRNLMHLGYSSTM